LAIGAAAEYNDGKEREPMPLGTSIFLIAVGAILRYAVTAHLSGVSLTTVGLIFIIVGIAGLILSLLYMATVRPRGGFVRDPYDEPPL
jgi:uncharacterized membrane protein YuzA (DUF378 family)